MREYVQAKNLREMIHASKLEEPGRLFEDEETL